MLYFLWFFLHHFEFAVFYWNVSDSKYSKVSRNFLRIQANLNNALVWMVSRGVMVKAMDCGIIESEFELLSRYYVHFRTNTLGKGMNPVILIGIG